MTHSCPNGSQHHRFTPDVVIAVEERSSGHDVDRDAEQIAKIILVFVHCDEVAMEPPTESARAWYRLHRSVIEAQGLELVDFIEFDTETMRSYAALEGGWSGSGDAA